MKSIKLECRWGGHKNGAVLTVGKEEGEVSLKDASMLIKDKVAHEYHEPVSPVSAALKGQLTKAKKEIEALNATIEKQNKEIEALNATIEKQNKEIEALKAPKGK